MQVRDVIAEFSTREVPAGAMCYLLGGVDRSTLNKYANEGLLVSGSTRGFYLLGPTLQNVVNKLREQASGRMGRSDDVDAVRSKAELQAAQQRLAEIRAAMLARELISMPEVEDAWREIALSVKQLFLSFPARVRFDLGLKPQEQKTLERLAHDMLHECATEGKLRLPATDQ